MGDTTSNSTADIKSKTSKAALWMFYGGLLGLLFITICSISLAFYDRSEGTNEIYGTISSIAFYLGFPILVIDLCLIPGTFFMFLPKGKKGGLLWLVGVVFVLLGWAVILPMFGQVNASGNRYLCSNNLDEYAFLFIEKSCQSGNDISVLAIWQDLLNGEKAYRCPSLSKRQKLSYALNKHLVEYRKDQLPDDVVLLFECRQGTGITGSAEDVDFTRHNSGCNILFADGHAEYILKEDFGKLHWMPNEGQPSAPSGEQRP